MLHGASTGFLRPYPFTNDSPPPWDLDGKIMNFSIYLSSINFSVDGDNRMGYYSNPLFF